MVRKQVDCPEEEPNQFEKPSEREHVLQVVDVHEDDESEVIFVEVHVAEGDEIGRQLRHRLNLNENEKSFFAVRMFLKAVGLPYKGKGIYIDTDDWYGRKFRATIIHKEHNGKKYANIDTYNYDVPCDNPPPSVAAKQEVQWTE